ncbi:AEC family transporter [Cuneatibacter sp. NSJ-177]|uniref:AEC family transporter n=1 Tax=Cuneatibacter sp. NSJ-177 TaxID=2931401 RepID=UPI001FD1BC6D|nr:AEC family transporter [Cuneatibacter sp. NSJ-177]MCJ7834145.1 AEC family transporter [Cuneatibacter sp. NSJ-177]
MDYSVVVVNIVEIFAMIGVGFAAGKFGVVSEKLSSELSSLLISVTLPASIFASMLREFDLALLENSILILCLGFGFLFLSIGLAYLLAKLFRVPKQKKGVWLFAATFTNASFMGFPVAQAVWGNDGLFLASILNLAFTILNFSIGVRMICLSSADERKIPWKKMLFTPINVAILLGLVFFVGRIAMPEPVAAVVRSLGQMTTPLSMFVIGLNMAAGSFVSLFQDKDALSVSVVRLVVVPLLVFAGLKLLPWRDNQVVCGVTMLLFAMPAPSLCLIFAEQYHSNTPMAVKVIFSSTLLSVITIPLLLLLL